MCVWNVDLPYLVAQYKVKNLVILPSFIIKASLSVLQEINGITAALAEDLFNKGNVLE